MKSVQYERIMANSDCHILNLTHFTKYDHIFTVEKMIQYCFSVAKQ